MFNSVFIIKFLDKTSFLLFIHAVNANTGGQASSRHYSFLQFRLFSLQSYLKL